MSEQHTLKTDLKVYRQPRVIALFFLALSSGFPWVMIGSALSAWLQEAGLSRSVIGYFGAVFAVYSVNFLWSPIVDSIKLPLLHRWLGQRRSWIVLCQVTIAALCIFISTLSIADNLHLVGITALLIAVSSATQDIAIDAYRIETFSESEGRMQSAGAAMATSGWWSGYAGLGAIPFLLVDGTTWQWQDAYIVLAALMLALATVTLVLKPARYTQVKAETIATLSLVKRVSTVIVEPISSFFKRNGVKLAMQILLFVFLFKIGEAFLGRMSIVFYKEIGFSNEQIGTYSKLVTWWITIIFSLLGGLVTLRIGQFKGLLIAGIAMAGSNLMFAWIANVGPSEHLFLAAVLVDGFTSAWSTVAFVGFISFLCDRTFTATQYALLASLSTFGRTTLSAYSGVLVDKLDGNWSLFFVLTSLAILPSLLLLGYLKRSYYAHWGANDR